MKNQLKYTGILSYLKRFIYIRPYFRKIWFATKPGGCSNDVLVLRANEDTNAKFLYYVLADNNFFNYSTVTSKGTKMPRGSKMAIMKYLVPDISIAAQQKIAEVLSAYDDLIENNNRRVELLEKAAQNLYKEWFVRFRFPNHKKTKFENGLPPGWNVKNIEEICKTVGGGTPSTIKPEYWIKGDIMWVTPTDITRNDCIALTNIEKKITKLGLDKSSAKLLPPNTILMTSRATIGYFGLIDKEICTNQGFISIIPNKEFTRMYILYNLINRKEEIISKASGATFKEISKSTFRKFNILLPSEDVLEEFNEIVISQLNLIRKLKLQNQNLTKQRDLLLPRLMSGKLEV